MADKITLNPNQTLAFEYLQGQDTPVTGRVIAEATGLNPQGIHGVLNSLVKKGLVEKAEPVIMRFVDKNGLESDHSYVTYRLTAAGVEFVQE
jgi:DNA-binding MarR family transcriptional regulator